MNGTGYAKSKLGKSALVVFKHESRPSRVLSLLTFLHVSQTKPTQKLGHQPSGRNCATSPQLCKFSQRHAQGVDGISSLHAKCPRAFSLSLSIALKEGCCLALPLSLRAPSPSPRTHQAGSCHSPWHIHSLFPNPPPINYRSNCISPFLQKIKYAMIVTCSKKVCFTKKML